MSNEIHLFSFTFQIILIYSIHSQIIDNILMHYCRFSILQSNESSLIYKWIYQCENPSMQLIFSIQFKSPEYWSLNQCTHLLFNVLPFQFNYYYYCYFCVCIDVGISVWFHWTFDNIVCINLQCYKSDCLRAWMRLQSSTTVLSFHLWRFISFRIISYFAQIVLLLISFDIKFFWLHYYVSFTSGTS